MVYILFAVLSLRNPECAFPVLSGCAHGQHRSLWTDWSPKTSAQAHSFHSLHPWSAFSFLWLERVKQGLTAH